VVFAICFRSLYFSPDTLNYRDIVQQYCAGSSLGDRELSFRVAAWLITAPMLGACRPDWVPMASSLMICALVMTASGNVESKLRYLALFLFSIVGIDLATNTIRQGLSVACLVAAISYLPRAPFRFAMLAVVAVLLHLSALLVIAAFFLAQCTWPIFAGIVTVSIVVVANLMAFDSDLFLVSHFFDELRILSAHDATELWIRVLAFATLTGTLVAAHVSRRRVSTAKTGTSGATTRFAERAGVPVRLALSCTPFLFVPYFGYRYIYGVYPLVLWMLLDPRQHAVVNEAKRIAAILVVNIAVLLAWTGGSSYFRSTPFFG
jgi:hypothetical protein